MRISSRLSKEPRSCLPAARSDICPDYNGHADQVGLPDRRAKPFVVLRGSLEWTVMNQETPAGGEAIGPLVWLKTVPFKSAAASHRLGWVGLEAVRYRMAPAFELSPPAISDHRLVLLARPLVATGAAPRRRRLRRGIPRHWSDPGADGRDRPAQPRPLRPEVQGSHRPAAASVRRYSSRRTGQATPARWRRLLSGAGRRALVSRTRANSPITSSDLSD
jgi:hypothetical protein